ncbi:MAG TPA: methyltransferase domain-containing protein [Longimicrobiales bacterium]|nr:methyltransferase domain-containing protein [Longimicrobiales bacterium]
MDKTLTAYDVSDHYDDAYFADLSARYRTRNRFARQRIANVFSLLPELRDQSFLDVGCGMGTFSLEAAKRGARAVGLDLAAAGIKAAKRVAKDENVETASFILSDAARLPLRTGSTDVVVAADFTEHLDDDTLGRVLQEISRVTRTGGTFVIYTPEASHVFERLRDKGILLEQEPSHIGIRSAGELGAFTEKYGFKVERISYLPSHLPGWNILERAFWRWIPLLRRRIGLVARRVA